MSFLLFGIVYTVCMQQWNQAAVFVILEVACGFLLYATAAIAATSQSIADGLLGFIRQQKLTLDYFIFCNRGLANIFSMKR